MRPSTCTDEHRHEGIANEDDRQAIHGYFQPDRLVRRTTCIAPGSWS